MSQQSTKTNGLKNYEDATKNNIVHPRAPSNSLSLQDSSGCEHVKFWSLQKARGNPPSFRGDITLYQDHYIIQSDQLEICPGCEIYTYCNSTCKESDWPIHKTECQCLANVLPDIPSDSTRMMLRLVIQRQNGDDLKMFGTNKLYQRRFEDLMSHSFEMKKHGECYDVPEFFKLVGNEIELPAHEVLLDIYGKMLINSFQIPDEFLNQIGTGLYLSTSKLDHSCAPNCVYTYNGIEQSVRALTYIEQPSPDKLFVSYINNAKPSWERRAQLNENYFFLCLCPWCVEESKRIDRIMTSVQCPNTLCSGFSGITKDDCGRAELLSCSSCGKIDFPVEFGREVVRLWVYATKRIKMLKEMDSNEDYNGLLKVAEDVLVEFDRSIMHESNLQFIRVRELAKGACIELGDWLKAAEYGEQAWIEKTKCIPHPSPSFGIQLFEQGKLLTNAGKINMAHDIFIKAENILRITHGLENRVYLELQDLIEHCKIVSKYPT